jgi:NADPH2:quinone reductase
MIAAMAGLSSAAIAAGGWPARARCPVWSVMVWNTQARAMACTLASSGSMPGVVSTEDGMRAVQAKASGGPEVLDVVEMPDPVPGPGQAVIAVSAIPLLYLDTQIRAGRAQAWFPVTPPYVLGAGVAGQVAAVGPGVDDRWAGRRVVADTLGGGGYLEQALVDAGSLVPVPDGLDLAGAAALLHDGRTAVGLMEALSPRPGEQVLVTGAAGGLGVLLVQLARRAGCRVIAAAGGPQKLDLARRLGAEQAVDYTRPGWEKQVLELTGGRGVDVVFDGAGGPAGQAAFAVTAHGGRFSAHGAPGGGFAPIDPGDARRREITVSGIDRVQFGPDEARRLTGQALAEAAAGHLQPVIGQRFPLEQAAEAHRVIEARAVTGKTLLEV